MCLFHASQQPEWPSGLNTKCDNVLCELFGEAETQFCQATDEYLRESYKSTFMPDLFV